MYRFGRVYISITSVLRTVTVTPMNVPLEHATLQEGLVPLTQALALGARFLQHRLRPRNLQIPTRFLSMLEMLEALQATFLYKNVNPTVMDGGNVQ